MKTTHFCCHRITRYARERNFVRFVIIIFFFLIFIFFFLFAKREGAAYSDSDLSLISSLYSIFNREFASIVISHWNKIQENKQLLMVNFRSRRETQEQHLQSSSSTTLWTAGDSMIRKRDYTLRHNIQHTQLIWYVDGYVYTHVYGGSCCCWWLADVLQDSYFCITQSQPKQQQQCQPQIYLQSISQFTRRHTELCFVRQSWAGIYKKLTRFFYWLAGSTCCHTKAYIAFRLLFYPWKSSYTSRDVVYVLCYVMSIPSSFCELLCVHVHVVYRWRKRR